MSIEGLVLSELVAAFGTPGLLVFCMWYFSRGTARGGCDPASQINEKLESIDGKVDQIGRRVTIVEVKLDERTKR